MVGGHLRTSRGEPVTVRLSRAGKENVVVSGVIIGYDPGGNDAHGVAMLRVEGGVPISLQTGTAACADEVMQRVEQALPLIAIGVDTLTCWSSGASGWRPADRWLRSRYPEVQNSVVTPNGLYGSMGLNGMAVLIEARRLQPNLLITETHPKMLHWGLSKGVRYNYRNDHARMNDLLAVAIGVDVAPNNEHEWDAAISAFAALEGVGGHWTNDLHARPTSASERLIWPCGKTHYYWPE